MPLTPELTQQVAKLLGRAPRGLEDVPVLTPDGAPVVIRVASLVEDKPFPTLFWLVGKEISYRIDQEEAGGLIAELQQTIDADPVLQDAMRDDHARYKAVRDGYMDTCMRERIRELGYAGVFQQKGIGGISDTGRIRCLHTWYAAHLVEPNTVGKLLDAHWEAQKETD